MTTCPDPAEFLPRFLDILSEAGELLRRHHEKPRNIRLKGRIDLVTETDVAVEAFLCARLAELLPQAGILAEESARDLELPALCWVIDPVDGTTNFAHGLPFVGISAALVHEGKPVLGAVNTPLLNELFHAVAGSGAWLNGARIGVSRACALEQSLAATGFPYDMDAGLPLVLARMEAFLPRCRGLRRCGAASVDLAWTACGRFDLYYETTLMPWDTAAGILLVQEAGGRVTHCDGSPVDIRRGDVLASNGLVHEEALAVMGKISARPLVAAGQ